MLDWCKVEPSGSLHLLLLLLLLLTLDDRCCIGAIREESDRPSIPYAELSLKQLKQLLNSKRSNAPRAHSLSQHVTFFSYAPSGIAVEGETVDYMSMRTSDSLLLVVTQTAIVFSLYLQKGALAININRRCELKTQVN